MADPLASPNPATYHEMFAADGSVRPHWQRLHDALQRSGPAQLAQRQALLTRHLQENGVTYNIYADPEGTDRPWELDLLPQLIPAPEWQQLATGIAQRAHLLNAVLADIYGPQQLIAEGLLAVCIQHECDHLNGKLFVDYLSNLKRDRIKKKLEKQHRQNA
ncbi:hypothetical protein G3435_02575 [Pseudomonas sp. MAFF212428]|uniref:Circularly permuted ATP-grasp type 2 domain-containing protein n=1 Tax=Pseudomonas brassicae TaxID=2708063 RepID=A0A6M0CPB2_9PSED|nr:hypothetical protein [Pseudomonas brassicae]